MKKYLLIAILVYFSVLTTAQNSDQKWAMGLGPGVSYNLETSTANFMHEIYFSRYLNSSFDVLIKNSIVWHEGLSSVNGFFNLRYKIYNNYLLSENASVHPYLFGGVGYLALVGDHINENYYDFYASGVNYNFGVGVKIPYDLNASWYFELAYVEGIEGTRNNQQVQDDYIKLSGIVEIAYGRTNDSDGDGVPDRKDECPNTPPGVQVDEKGCPLDRDGDGIPDYQDDCPDEPGEERFNGCPDRDGDGIPDNEDECPDTPGLAKFKGCPDTDEDGVPDPDDKCPDTPKGCPVDAEGCPLDSDGDGVIDCEDRCPNEAGPADNGGCPVEWETIEVPNIYFDFDKSFLRPEGKEKLDELVEKLDDAKEYEIEVGGHTDAIGTEQYNMGLSERRAESVVKYLLSKGVSNVYVSSNYYGESDPAVPNTSPSNRQLNRRVEFEKVRIKE